MMVLQRVISDSTQQVLQTEFSQSQQLMNILCILSLVVYIFISFAVPLIKFFFTLNSRSLFYSVGIISLPFATLLSILFYIYKWTHTITLPLLFSASPLIAYVLSLFVNYIVALIIEGDLEDLE